MKRLRREVERVVAPLRATPWRKNRMREELLAHLTALYEDERSHHPEPAQALARAVARFGEPAELIRSLQASVPFAERVLWYQFPGHTWKNRHPGETAVAHILRSARYATVCVVLANLVLVGVVAIIGLIASRRPVPEKPPLVNVAAFLAICAACQLVLTIVPPLCGELIHRQAALHRTAISHRRRMRHAALVALGLLLASMGGAIVTAVVAGTFEPLLYIPIVTTRQFWWIIAGAAATFFVLTIIQSWQQAQANRQFEDFYADDYQLAD